MGAGVQDLDMSECLGVVHCSSPLQVSVIVLDPNGSSDFLADFLD